MLTFVSMTRKRKPTKERKMADTPYFYCALIEPFQVAS